MAGEEQTDGDGSQASIAVGNGRKARFWSRGRARFVAGMIFLVGTVGFLANLTTVMGVFANAGFIAPPTPPPVSIIATIANKDSNSITVGELIECTPMEIGGSRPIEYPSLRTELRPLNNGSFDIRGHDEVTYRVEFDRVPWLKTLIDRGGADLFCKVGTIGDSPIHGSAWFPLQRDMIENRRMLIELNEPS